MVSLVEYSRRAASIKTRIETSHPISVSCMMLCRRAASTKTRIETRSFLCRGQLSLVAGRHPLKQGLKHMVLIHILCLFDTVAGRHPLKQGLKQSSFATSSSVFCVAGRHPLKQGLKLLCQSCKKIHLIQSQGGIH